MSFGRSAGPDNTALTDPRTQRIGDVLLSTSVLDYELQRAGTDDAGRLIQMPRGDRPIASPRLVGRFQMARLHTCGLTPRVCDWADGRKHHHKEDRRNVAAHNAALAVLRTLERGGFAG